MTVTIIPSQPAGAVAAPPSKSMAHRALICAGLAGGESRVRGIAPSQDVLATVDCLRALGAEVAMDGGTAAVRGTDPAGAPGAVLPCRESGSTLRFFAPICALSAQPMTLTGAPSLLRRPLGVYETLFRERGLPFAVTETALSLRGALTPGAYALPGDVSSQFVSGLLFALPSLPGDSVITLRPPVESRGYIDMTLAALGAFGVEAHWRDETTLAVPGGQRFLPRDITVEGDWSNAAFFLALGVPVTGLDPESLQGDRVCVECFDALRRGPATVDIADCPDLGPVLFAFAAGHHGGVFRGTRRLRMKESDRGEAMSEELRKFGAEVTVDENTVTVGCALHAPTEPLDGHNDHRIVMALSVLCAQTGGTIRGAEAVSKSFPDFFDRLKDINIEMEIR